jgi:hypothetical protein
MSVNVRASVGRRGGLPLPLLPLTLALVMAAGAVHASPADAIAANPDPGLIARWEPCEPDTGVTVMVDDHTLGEGKVYVGCAAGEQENGAQALIDAGFAIEGVRGEEAFICRIGGEPTVAEESCEITPGAGDYWSYWHAQPGGSWGYSGTGAYGYKPALGSVEGWGFGAGGPPRIEPMDGSGPSSFVLPPEQQSSTVPTQIAREWLTHNVDETAEGYIQTVNPQELLEGVEALAQAGVEPARMSPVAHGLERPCEADGKPTGEQGCAVRDYSGMWDGDLYPERLALIVDALHALAQNPEGFAGMDLRGDLEGTIEEGPEEGKIRYPAAAGTKPTEDSAVIASVVLALARTGPLSAKALASLDLLLSPKNVEQLGRVGNVAGLEAIQALVAAREQGVDVIGESRLQEIGAALQRAAHKVEGLQTPEGGIAEEAGGKADDEESGIGAAELALAGDEAAAERAAQWMTHFQVTAEYAGIGNAETGEHTPAEDLIGAFIQGWEGPKGDEDLRAALRYGLGPPDSEYGPLSEARIPTIDALFGLAAAGPYGPYDAKFVQESLFFEKLAYGVQSAPIPAFVTNKDVRPVTITGASITGADPGDFRLDVDKCVGTTLQQGLSCEMSVSFAPTGDGSREAQVQLSIQSTSQTIVLPLTGTGYGAPEPSPPIESKPGSGPGPILGPMVSTAPLVHGTSGSVAGVAVESISSTRLLLRFVAPGVATVRIARLRGKGRQRRWQIVKTIPVKATRAGALDVRLPRLAAGSYRVSISYAGAKTVLKTLTVPSTRR